MWAQMRFFKLRETDLGMIPLVGALAIGATGFTLPPTQPPLATRRSAAWQPTMLFGIDTQLGLGGLAAAGATLLLIAPRQGDAAPSAAPTARVEAPVASDPARIAQLKAAGEAVVARRAEMAEVQAEVEAAMRLRADLATEREAASKVALEEAKVALEEAKVAAKVAAEAQVGLTGVVAPTRFTGSSIKTAKKDPFTGNFIL